MYAIDQRIARETRERRRRLGMIPGPPLYIKQPAPEIVFEPLPDFPQPPPPPAPPPLRMATHVQICRAVADAFNVDSYELLRSQRRFGRLCVPRFAAMLLCHELLPLQYRSLTRIGRYLNRDHTSVLHGLRRAKEMQETDPRFAAMLGEARALLAPGGKHALD